MSAVNLIVIVESVQKLITGSGELNKFHLPSLLAVAAALGKEDCNYDCNCQFKL